MIDRFPPYHPECYKYINTPPCIQEASGVDTAELERAVNESVQRQLKNAREELLKVTRSILSYKEEILPEEEESWF